MVKRRISFKARQEEKERKERESNILKELISSIKERTEVVNVHLDQVIQGKSSVLLLTEHLDRYIGNLILFNNKLKEIAQ